MSVRRARRKGESRETNDRSQKKPNGANQLNGAVFVKRQRTPAELIRRGKLRLSELGWSTRGRASDGVDGSDCRFSLGVRLTVYFSVNLDDGLDESSSTSGKRRSGERADATRR